MILTLRKESRNLRRVEIKYGLIACGFTVFIRCGCEGWAAARMLVFADQQESASAEHWCKATLAASAGQLCILFGSIKQCVLA